MSMTLQNIVKVALTILAYTGTQWEYVPNAAPGVAPDGYYYAEMYIEWNPPPPAQAKDLQVA